MYTGPGGCEMRVAIVGSGIAGLGCAYLLRDRHELTLFEADDRLGGHAHTVTVPGAGGDLALDTGFLVHNRENYPQLTRLFVELGVATQPSEMTFSVRREADGLEYSGRGPIAQPHVLARPRLLRLLRGVARFLRTAGAEVDHLDATETLDHWARRRGHGGDVLDLYLIPMCAALWSADPDDAGAIPARFVLRFFDQHGLLGFDRHRWRTVSGGSQTYVAAIAHSLEKHDVRLEQRVGEVRRGPDAITVRVDGGEPESFDAVVMACHPDQSLALLADPSDRERELLGAFRYTTSEALLHTDPSPLPRRRRVQASWNYLLPAGKGCGPRVTYLLNRLQALDEPLAYCVSLNCDEWVDPARVLRRISYAHPLFSADSVAAQPRLAGLGHDRRTAFCGAWQGWGFHEDGLVSGIAAAQWLGAEW